MNRNGQPWTALECQVAARMYAEKKNIYGDHERFLFAIAKELGRSVDGVRGRLRKYGRDFGEDDIRRWHRKKKESELEQHVVHVMNVPPRVLAERDRRSELRPTSTTAMLCGDPLPGYSALDRRQEA